MATAVETTESATTDITTTTTAMDAAGTSTIAIAEDIWTEESINNLFAKGSSCFILKL
jgi:hypothetical protein